MGKYYIVGAAWIDKQGNPQWCAFDIFRNNHEAGIRLREMQNMPDCKLHFCQNDSKGSKLTWGISIL